MGDVVDFAERRERARRPARAKAGEVPAEILLFVGVRYERMVEPVLLPAPGGTAGPRPGSGRRKRRAP